MGAVIHLQAWVSEVQEEMMERSACGAVHGFHYGLGEAPVFVSENATCPKCLVTRDAALEQVGDRDLQALRAEMLRLSFD